MIAFARNYIITAVLSYLGTRTSAVIMENLAKADPLVHHFKQWCCAVIAFARFYISTAVLSYVGIWTSVVKMENLANAVPVGHHFKQWC